MTVLVGGMVLTFDDLVLVVGVALTFAALLTACALLGAVWPIGNPKGAGTAPVPSPSPPPPSGEAPMRARAREAEGGDDGA